MVKLFKFLIIFCICILISGCIVHEEYYSSEDALYKWNNSQFIINSSGSLDYRYQDNGTIKNIGVTNYVLIYKEIAGKLYVISDEQYCIIDKNNLCRVYVYDKPLMPYYKKVYAYTQEQYCYSINMDIIYEDNFVRLNSFEDFSKEEQSNIIYLKNKALKETILYNSKYITIMKTRFDCALYYNCDLNHKINLMGRVSGFKSVDDKIYVSGLLYEKNDLNSADYAVIDGSKIKLYNIFLRENNGSKSFSYSNENIIEYHNFNDFSEEEKKILHNIIY